MAAVSGIDRRQMGWLLLALALPIAPHLLRLPPWISATFLLLFCWRLMATWRGWPLPSKKRLRLLAVKHGLALGIFGGVVASYGRHLGRDAGLALLVALLGLKLLEVRQARDHFVVLLVACFLVATNFFFGQRIPAALLMLLDVWLILAALLALNDPTGALTPRRQLRLAGLLVLQAVPLALVAFLLFPRVNGPLWGLPQDAYGAVSGLSGEMSPGAISRLILSDRVAFRVRFEGETPPPSRLYWRGPVLWQSDGRTWRARPLRITRHDPEPPRVEGLGEAMRYTITLEPHNRRWLFPLEMPATLPPGARLTGDLQLLAGKKVQQRRRYTLSSHPRYRLQEPDPEALRRGLQLPPGAHPRARALAAQWRQETQDPAQLVRRALQFFRDFPFHYSLSPPPIPGDLVDGFLFGTRRGFCEHYAIAFTVLMRAAGVPVRVVTGYQGGEFNPVGGYLVVRQRDAHAWTEVWLGERGWVRVDPTAAVSPARIEQGIGTIAPTGLVAIGPLADNPVVQGLWQRLRNSVDAINNAWNQWVLSYGPQRQRLLFQRLGLGRPDWKQLAAWLGGAMALLLGLLILLEGRQRGNSDPAVRLWRRFCRRLAREGLPRLPAEGPLDYARRARAARPEKARQITDITRRYIEIRYGAGGDLRALRRAVRRF